MPSDLLLACALGIAAVAAVRGVWSPCGLSMLSSLNPVAERARGHRFGLTAAWYVAGAAAGGALLGAVCALPAWGLGALRVPGVVTWALVLAVAAVTVASDTGFGGRSLPVHPRQVDERWLGRYRRWLYAGGYGVQIGTGFATYIMTSAVYLTASLAALTGRPGAALLVGAVFGTVRGLAIVVCARARTPERLRALLAAVDRHAGPSRWVATGAQVVVLGVAGWAVGSLPGAVAATGAGGLMVARAVRRRTLPACASPAPQVPAGV